MEIPSVQSAVQASELPLEMVANNTHLSEEAKVAEVSRQFEAIMLRQILREAQKNVSGSTLFPESFSTSIYQDLMSQQLADSISKSGKFGLADSFKEQLTQQVGVAKNAATAGTVATSTQKLSQHD